MGERKNDDIMLKCALGLHHYEIVQEEDLKQVGTDMTIGKAFVCRCTECGKFKVTDLRTVTNIYIG